MPGADISVIFPYYNEARTIRTTLELISAQTLMPREVLFVNSSSTDDSPGIIDAWIRDNQARFKTEFHNVFAGTDTPSSSKNAGIRRAASAWIAFMDCGQNFEKDWLEKQWAYVQAHPGAELVSGGCISTGAGLIDMSAVAQIYGYKRFLPTVPTTLVKKSVFDKTGLFLENRRAGYDLAWALRIKKLGIQRGINESVAIRYIGVNYGNSLLSIFKKAFTYAAPTVAMPCYYTPYYYLAALLAFLGCVAFRPASFWYFLSTYIIFRGYVVPIMKSGNLSLFKERKLALATLPLLGAVIDSGRTLGIFKGLWLYHIKAR